MKKSIAGGQKPPPSQSARRGKTPVGQGAKSFSAPRRSGAGKGVSGGSSEKMAGNKLPEKVWR